MIRLKLKNMQSERKPQTKHNLIESSFLSVKESIFFKKPESVGTIRILDVFADRNYFLGYDMAILDFGKLKDSDVSPIVYHVPKGLIKEDSIVEVVVKQSRWKTEPKAVLLGIRPFKKENYGIMFGRDDRDLNSQFSFNLKFSDSSKMFFDKFLTSRLRKGPPFRF